MKRRVAAVALTGGLVGGGLAAAAVHAWPSGCHTNVSNVSVSSVCYNGNSGDGYRQVGQVRKGSGFTAPRGTITGPWRTPGKQSIAFIPSGWTLTSHTIQKIDCCMAPV